MSAPIKRSSGVAVGTAFGIALICLPVFMHLALLDLIWFAGIGVSVLFFVFADFSKTKESKGLLSRASTMTEDGIVVVLVLLPLLYLAYLLLRRFFEL